MNETQTKKYRVVPSSFETMLVICEVHGGFQLCDWSSSTLDPLSRVYGTFLQAVDAVKEAARGNYPEMP